MTKLLRDVLIDADMPEEPVDGAVFNSRKVQERLDALVWSSVDPRRCRPDLGESAGIVGLSPCSHAGRGSLGEVIVGRDRGIGHAKDRQHEPGDDSRAILPGHAMKDNGVVSVSNQVQHRRERRSAGASKVEIRAREIRRRITGL